MMGLHCHDSTPGQIDLDLDLSLDEIVERRKLFRSLYIRERCYATARGTLRRLPRYLPQIQSGSSSRAMSQDASSAPWTSGNGESSLEAVSHPDTNEPLFTMAVIQDELHAAMFPGSQPDTRRIEQEIAVSAVRQKLVAFSQAHRLPALKRPRTFQDLSLHLAFLGTRIRAYELRLAEDNERHILDDARLSCLLVMSACSDEKGLGAAMSDMLDKLLQHMAHRDWCTDSTSTLSQSPGGSRRLSAAVSAQGEEQLNSPQTPNKRFWPFGSDPSASPNSHLLRRQRVLELMPTSSMFILGRNILRFHENVASAHRPSGPSSSDPTANETSEDELFGSAATDFMILCELERILEPSLEKSNETQNSYSSKLFRVTHTLVSFLRETVNLPEQQSSSLLETTHDMLECTAHTEMAQDGMMNLSANATAAEASFMGLSTSWDSPQASNSLSFPFSPSFDLSSMNITNVPDSLFDFDFSQHFENVGGLMSPAEHLPGAETLRTMTDQEKRRKRLRLDCSQEMDGPADVMMSTWPQRNRVTMARGSV
jgi:hypothetical protein